jgi:hypothetical protein
LRSAAGGGHHIGARIERHDAPDCADFTRHFARQKSDSATELEPALAGPDGEEVAGAAALLRNLRRSVHALHAADD